MPIARAAPRIALALSLALPARAPAQVRASEAASVSQTVDGTKITIEYSRPRGRARDSLFGKVVPWGEVWTAGANLATTLAFVVTDAACDPRWLQAALKDAATRTYNEITVDGDTSTNDSIFAFASGVKVRRTYS